MGNTHSPRKTHCEPQEEIIIQDERKNKYRIMSISNFMYCSQTYEMKWIFLQNMYELMDFNNFTEVLVFYLSLEYLSDQFDRLKIYHFDIYNQKYQEVYTMKIQFLNELDNQHQMELERVMSEIQIELIDKMMFFQNTSMKQIHQEFMKNFNIYIDKTIINKQKIKNTSYSSLIEIICWYRISTFF